MLPAMPASRNEVIYGHWLLSSDFYKTSWSFLHDPVCPKRVPVLSKNLAHSVLKPGPFCPWNVVRFVLRRGPFCPETWSVLSGPFCPWSVLSEYRPFTCAGAEKVRSFRALSITFGRIGTGHFIIFQRRADRGFQ